MNFEFTPEDEAFRLEVREFLRANLPAEIAQDVRRWVNPPMRLARAWQRILAAKGWGAPHWPVEYGGCGWGALRKHIFLEEIYRADAPDYMWQGLHMMAWVLIAYGSPEQKRRFLPPMLTGEEVWAQGFSEPGAGSDLANLRTAAVLDGEVWRINGQKIWTSDAADSDWGFFLVRTDPTLKPQRGLSFLIAKLDTPGITIRPIRSIDGRNELNEVFLDNVTVPRDHLVGEAGKGWTYAKYLLEKERTASAFLYFNKRILEKAKALARETRVAGRPLLQIAEFACKVARIEADLAGLEYSVLRVLAEEKFAHPLNGVVSALKVRGSLLQQRITDLHTEAMGAQSLRFLMRGDERIPGAVACGRWPELGIGATSMFMQTRASTIYGGALEVQKNIIAKSVFGF
jgi:alkylation response protein AidB-like acyl-CoA dehydrogenase